MSDPAQDDTQSPICPKCGGRMEHGFLLDRRALGEGPAPSEWVQGNPVPSFWSGLKTNVRRKVVTYRCTTCGYLESYALDVVD